MPYGKKQNFAKELQQLDYNQVAAFDEEATRGEALAFYDNCQIENAVVYRNKISGRVGNYIENYQVKVVVYGPEISSTCECDNERKICQHAIALLYGWVNDSEDFLNIDKVLCDIEKLDKKQLLEIVVNVLQHAPHLAPAFLKQKTLDWDEIELDPA